MIFTSLTLAALAALAGTGTGNTRLPGQAEPNHNAQLGFAAEATVAEISNPDAFMANLIKFVDRYGDSNPIGGKESKKSGKSDDEILKNSVAQFVGKFIPGLRRHHITPQRFAIYNVYEIGRGPRILGSDRYTQELQYSLVTFEDNDHNYINFIDCYDPFSFLEANGEIENTYAFDTSLKDHSIAGSMGLLNVMAKEELSDVFYGKWLCEKTDCIYIDQDGSETIYDKLDLWKEHHFETSFGGGGQSSTMGADDPYNWGKIIIVIEDIRRMFGPLNVGISYSSHAMSGDIYIGDFINGLATNYSLSERETMRGMNALDMNEVLSGVEQTASMSVTSLLNLN